MIICHGLSQIIKVLVDQLSCFLLVYLIWVGKKLLLVSIITLLILRHIRDRWLFAKTITLMLLIHAFKNFPILFDAFQLEFGLFLISVLHLKLLFHYFLIIQILCLVSDILIHEVLTIIFIAERFFGNWFLVGFLQNILISLVLLLIWKTGFVSITLRSVFFSQFIWLFSYSFFNCLKLLFMIMIFFCIFSIVILYFLFWSLWLNAFWDLIYLESLSILLILTLLLRIFFFSLKFFIFYFLNIFMLL